MIILGLDQSSNCGWAVGPPGGKPRWGTWRLPNYGQHEGRTFWAIVDWLGTFIKSEGVTHVFWEQVWVPPQIKLDTNKLFKLIAFANAIQAACVDPRRGIDIPDAYVTPGDWRKAFHGTAGGGRDYQKQLAMKSCAMRGWFVANDHEAEACGIWEYGCLTLDKKTRWLAQSRMRRQEAEQDGVR